MTSGTEKRVRDFVLPVRLAADERATVDAAAERAGLTVSSYARQAMLGGPAPRAVSRKPADRRELVRILGQLGHIGGNLNQLAKDKNTGAVVYDGEIATAARAVVEMRDAVLIIKGNAVTGAAALARYLQNDKNERVTVLEIKGTVANDLHGALMEMDAYADGTKCTKALYHGKISPAPPYTLTREQAIKAADVMEAKLGLKDHARVIVMHEHDGRQHFHPIWTRIDLENLRAVPDSHNYRKHEEAARELERRFGHPRVQGAHAERDGVERPERTPSQAELAQEQRTGIKGKEVKAEVTTLFVACDGAEAFRAALEDRGYILARGDRRDFVIVDRAGGIHNLARRIDGMKAAALREFMKPLDRESLPDTERAKEAQLDRASGTPSAHDAERWDNALAASGIEKAKQIDKDQERRSREALEARKEARVGKKYASGDDYVSQSTAALKHHKRRQRKANREPRPQSPDHNLSAYERMKSSAEEKKADEPEKRPSAYERMKSKLAGMEITDRMSRLLDRAGDEGRADDTDRRADRDPDRQNEASGDGRTRSR